MIALNVLTMLSIFDCSLLHFTFDINPMKLLLFKVGLLMKSFSAKCIFILRLTVVLEVSTGVKGS